MIIPLPSLTPPIPFSWINRQVNSKHMLYTAVLGFLLLWQNITTSNLRRVYLLYLISLPYHSPSPKEVREKEERTQARQQIGGRGVLYIGLFSMTWSTCFLTTWDYQTRSCHHPQWAGLSYINYQSRTHTTGFPRSQTDRIFFSIELT